MNDPRHIAAGIVGAVALGAHSFLRREETSAPSTKNKSLF